MLGIRFHSEEICMQYHQKSCNEESSTVSELLLSSDSIQKNHSSRTVIEMKNDSVESMEI